MQLTRTPTTTLTGWAKALQVAGPEPYHGDSEKFADLISQLYLVFNTDPQRYSQDTAKLAYTVSLLRGSSKRWFPLHVNQSTGIVAFSSFHTFITALKEAFNDLDSATTAEPKLRSLTQGTDSCSTFHSKFVSYVAILNLDEKSQVMWFRNGLREQVKDLLIARDLPTNFNNFVELCIKLDNPWRSR